MTETLKNMLKSVDWSKLVSSGDAKNALVGSALGGIMLGGASLAQDHDPEEGKSAPVGDALMGALLGGAAGYGIPKGLAMFRDAGHMAPDSDQLGPARGLAGKTLSAAAWGGGIGTGALAAQVAPAYLSAAKRIINGSIDTYDAARTVSSARLRDWVEEYKKLIAAGKANSPQAMHAAGQVATHFMTLRRIRRAMWMGILGASMPQKVIMEMPYQTAEPPSLRRLFKGKGKGKGTRLTPFINGRSYAPAYGRGAFGIGSVRLMGPVGRLFNHALRRGAKGAVIGAGLTLAWPSAKRLASMVTGTSSAD